MINLIAAASAWIMPVLLVALFGLMLVVTIIPQKKRKKQAQEMMSTLAVGSQVRTIGGFVGIVCAIDDATNILTLNVGSEENPVIVTLDKAAIYTVVSSVETEVPVVTEAGAVVEEDSIVSLDDAEEAAKTADKKALKASKKAKKDKEKAEAKDAEVSEITEDTNISDVFAEESVEAEVVEAEIVETKDEASL